MIQKINSTMKIQFRHTRVFTFLLTLLLLCGAGNKAWAIKAYYHILTLPIHQTADVNFRYDYKLESGFEGKRLEAVCITVNNAQTVELPDAYKSPLATNFKYYYDGDNIVKSAATQKYNTNTATKAKYFSITNESANVTEKTAITSKQDVHIYVTYEYDDKNTIADLSGNTLYNITMNGCFLALNMGRNNRPATIPQSLRTVSAEHLAKNDFHKIDVSGTNITTYWASGNKNPKALVESRFNLLFKFEGKDPYNIIIANAYDQSNTYIETHGGETDIYKWYKGSHLFGKNSGDNLFIASDDHKQYTQQWKKTDTENPTYLEPDESKHGYFHTMKGNLIWNSFALLNNSDKNGYVFMVSNSVNGSGEITASDSKFNFLMQYTESGKNNNNLRFGSLTLAGASAYSTDKKIYPIRDVNFKVKTPFYELADEEDKEDHIVTAAAKLSQYTIDNGDIDASFIPDELRRKYCTFTTFRNSAGTIITKYADAYNSSTKEYDVYVDYSVDASIPFKAITPKSTYTADDFTNASWYELTDDGSTEANGKKLQVYQDGVNYKFKNNGASGTYEKTSEYAFIGDPYELRVISRSQTSGGTPSYVGATGTPTATTPFTASTTASAGYIWEMPQDATAGSFNLRIFSTNNSGTGYWSWDTGNASVDVPYTGTTVTVATPLTSNAQNITLNVSNLETTYGNHLIVEATSGATTQVGTITVGDILSNRTATITVAIAANSSTDKTFTLTITEKNEGGSTVGTATAVTITQGTTAYAGGNVQYNTTATRVKVLTLPTRTYTYKIVDKFGRIAVKASIDQTIFSSLTLASIPSIIVSPFLQGETVTFYDDSYTDKSGRENLTHTITETPNVNHDIFVTYTTSSLDSKPIKLSEDQEFNVVLNGQYIYYNSSDGGSIMSKTTPEPAELQNKNFLWKLRNRDPYNMLIDNVGARTSLGVADQTEPVTVYNDNGVSVDDEGRESSNLSYVQPNRQKGAWVWLNGADLPTTSEGTALAFTTTRANAQQFIAKAALQGGVYEVMVAAGDGIDAGGESPEYYDIGRTSSEDIKIYNNTTYAHGNTMLRFQLQQSEDYVYHLIDMAHHELLELTSQSADLVLPAEYQSPLVEAYSYYAENQMTIDESKTPHEYTPNGKGQLSALTDLDAKFTTYDSDATEWGNAGDNQKTATDPTDMEKQAKRLTEAKDYYFRIGEESSYSYKKVTVSQAFRGLNIYVTYKANDRVKYNDNASPYLLKFLNPYADGYYLEDGSDKLIPYVDSDLKKGKVQAVYPYTNGDGNLYIYSEAMNKEQMTGGANTRPRWVWFFESENSDPYHVMIHSKSTISYNSVSHPTYLQTYAVKFKQDGDASPKHIVTGGTLPTIASETPTEYMVLGTDGQFKLRTTNLIEGARQDVTSLEQYWKTYNMIKLHVLEINPKTDDNYKDKFSNDESTWVVPDALRETLQTNLGNLHIGSGQWHSYDAYANATRWNGYNDKTDGHEKKVVERLEHWFQTFEMGDGTFDIESADIPPVLILIDRHGWEIMRKPLPNISTYPDGDDELAALMAYDSPMVKEYKFYSNATKATGCHKYSLRMQNGAERDQIKVGGKHYTSTSLGILPPIEATGVNIDGVLQDQYVTYTVKDEYEDSYTYNFVDHGDGVFTESGTASKFLMVQNGRFYKNKNSNDRESYISKPIFEYTNPEGGNVYDLIVNPHGNDVQIVTDGKISNNCLWYVGPNLDIDKEMGIKYAAEAGATGEPWTEYETKKNYFETGKGGFDPYNIQLKNIGESKFLTSHMTKTTLRDGVMLGDYTSGNTRMTLETEYTSYPADATVSTGSEGYDHTNIAMTNQTFMAVSDANGNMQLMPRFDHTKRINVPTTAPNNDPWPTTLEDPVDYNGEAKVDDNSKMGPQTTFFVRPQRFVYRIIDNDGNEALRYKRAGDYYPTITEHFMSPLATDFKFYYDHAAYTASVSSKAAYDAAATTGYFKKTAASAKAMETTAKQLTVLGDYYFKITSDSYKYVKVIVTSGYVAPSTNAVYTTEVVNAKDYTDDLTATDDADMKSKADALTEEGTYYYKINTYDYKKVTVTKAYVASPKADATYTTADCTETDWTNAVVQSCPTVASLEALETAVDSLTVKGTHFYKIGPYVKDAKSTYIYKKVVVKSGKSNFLADVAAKRDVSDKEITGKALAEFDFDSDECEVFVRYSYNESADKDADKILQGKWFTVDLAGKNLQSSGTINSDGTGVSLFTGTSKPATVDEDDKTWQWKFLVAPIDPTSDLHISPDPYAIQIFNRDANKDTSIDPSTSKMRIPIKVNGKDRFSLLRHPSGGYALAVNGLGTELSYNYTYDFLNGAGMTTSVGATTATEVNYQRTKGNYETLDPATYFSGLPDGDYYFRIYDNNKNVSYKKFSVTNHTPSPEVGEASSEEEWNNAYHFTIKSGVLSPGTQLVLNNDVMHNYEYRVINNGSGEYAIANPGSLAVTATQDNAAASSNDFAPYLPEAAQTPLLRNKDDEYEGDYLYYGSATKDDKGNDDPSDDTYTVATQTKLFTLHGLYDDIVYVRYKEYDMDNTPFKVPNKRSESSPVARHSDSHDAAMNIEGKLPYNIIWESDNMMSTETEDATAINDAGAHDHKLDGDAKYVWYFTGNDPYNLKIEHKKSGNYVYNSEGTTCVLHETNSTPFMLLKKSGYNYGILQVVGTTGDAAQRLTGFGGSLTANASTDPTKFIIFGLSVHDLIYRLIIAKTNTTVKIPYRKGDESTYQTSDTWSESNTKDIIGSTQRDLTAVNTGEGTHYAGEKYQLGETLPWGGANHIYSYDAGTVSVGDVLEVPSVFYRPNCTFDFYIQDIYGSDKTTVQTDLNNKYKGLKLNNLMSDAALIDKTVIVNIVYSFNKDLATNSGMDFVRSVDQNLWYTFETQEASVPQLVRYTKTQGLKAAAGRETHYTNDYLFTPLGDVYGFKMYNRYTLKNGTGDTDKDKVMTTTALTNNTSVTVAEPSATYPAGNEIYELISGDIAGYFRVHPVANTKEQTQVYIKKEGSSLILSTTPQDWTYRLDIAMLQPYYLGAGNVGGLNAAGKALYKTEIDKGEGNYKITDIQAIVYNDDYIVHFTPGYYRLHSQPGVTGVSPVRYASGYLHDIEKTAVSGGIPMHFYSRQGVSTIFGGTEGLESGFTETAATRGDIPIAPTEKDPSTIFYIDGSLTSNRTISNVTMSTQGLNVIENKMGIDAASQYKMMDIGGGVVLLYTELGEPKTTTYLTYDQSSKKYDLKYQSADFHIDQLKWCVEPANTMGLNIKTNNGGDGYYYATLYLPYDVLLPDDDDDKTYYAYTCKKWHNEGVNPVPVPAVSTYAEGKFVPAGTPVIIRTNDETGTVKLTLPNTTTSTALPCVFKGEYLEQLLAVDADHDVYTLGLPFDSDVHKDNTPEIAGDIESPLPHQANNGVGFYINANPNKEHSDKQARWTRNNRYVLHNKIYYREPASSPSSAPQQRAPEFVPVIFDDEEEQKEMNPNGTMEMVGDGCIYDLMGRKVATREQVEDGSWWNQATPGVYILNGRKVIKK